MEVGVGVSHVERVKMNQVIMSVNLLEIGDDYDMVMDSVNQRVKKLLEKLGMLGGIVTEVQRVGIHPHMVLMQDGPEERRRTERVQKGIEGYALLTVEAVLGETKLNPIAEAVKYVKGSMSVRYSLSNDVREQTEAIIRSKLLDKAAKQCSQLLNVTSGKAGKGVVIAPAEVSYHSQVSNNHMTAYRASEQAAVGSVPDADEVCYDLDAIYTRDNAPFVDIRDSVDVAFKVKGYELQEG